MKNRKIIISLLIFPILFFSGEIFSDEEFIFDDERLALLEFKSSVWDPSGHLSSWVPHTNGDDFYDHCSWYGVACDSDYRVSAIAIPAGGGGGGDSCFDVNRFPFYGFGIRRHCSRNLEKLMGTLSPGISRLAKIRVLSIPFNGLSGEIPSGVWGLELLEVLDLEGNSIEGNLRSSFGGLRRLRVMNLGFNRIGGVIPDSVSRLDGLEFLNLACNELVGSIPGFVGGASKLKGLYLSMNRLTGEFPGSIDSECSELEYLDLSGNRLSGSIPGSLGDCRNLRVLLLFGNRLRGAIPSTLGQLRKLEVLDVSRNGLCGPVPAELGNCLELSVLVLSNLYDPFPADRGPRGLPMTDFSVGVGEGNSFGGRLPVRIASLPKLRLLWAPRVALKGKILKTWRASDSLEMINLSMNRFTGEIKGIFVDCRNLVYIDLSSNRLSGDLDENLVNPCVIVFNVSGNNVSGSILSSTSNICQPTASWISGPPPSGKHAVDHHFGRNMPSRSLQSSSEYLNYDVTPPSSGRSDRFNSIEIASIVCAAVIILVFLALAILFICTRKCLPEDSSRVEVLEKRRITTFMDIGVPLTFEKIVEATENFSSSNCIGSGGFGATHKAKVSSGITVAVKRLAVGRFHCVQQFHAEIQTLGKIRHQNLVTLVGYHASEAEMFLIYNYLPGGNLEGFIQERGSRQVNWRTIHKIALDIANALAYLHDECDPRVIHRDVKPSNILLDNDLNAYLSDFGLSRLLGPTETHATTGVAGTFGYLAPEYALTCRVSDKCDVYSYGVVLLELISDKKALDPSFSSHSNGYNIVPWACMMLRQGRSKEVFTAGIWEEGPQGDLVEVLYLAVKCTVDTLSIRPTMRQVVQREVEEERERDRRNRGREREKDDRYEAAKMCGIALIVSEIRLTPSSISDESISPSTKSESVAFTVDDLKAALRRRGPDSLGSKRVLVELEHGSSLKDEAVLDDETDSEVLFVGGCREMGDHGSLDNGENGVCGRKILIEMDFVGAVLQLRGEDPVVQPLVNASGNILVYNDDIDLLNVSFEDESAPDRITAGAGVEELKRVAPSRRYKSKARILLVGSGADEQCAGYGRHRTKFRSNSGSGKGTLVEMIDVLRTMARFPFLDEDVIRVLLDIPLWEIADLNQPTGTGDKKILREVARLLVLHDAAALPKTAIQFGSRIAHESNRKNFGSNRAANMASAGSVEFFDVDACDEGKAAHGQLNWDPELDMHHPTVPRLHIAEMQKICFKINPRISLKR
ncbi:LRR receptor-like serine/threonine-protein kinase RPK2-like protein [Drosera capensis]